MYLDLQYLHVIDIFVQVNLILKGLNWGLAV